MKQGLSSRTLQTARRCLTGDASLDELHPLLDELATVTAAAQEHFADNPEVSEELAVELSAALEAYRRQIDRLRDPSEQGVEESESAFLRVRAASRRQADATRQPTGYLFLNRMLCHIEYYVSHSGRNPHTAVLLTHLPDFLTHLETDVDRVSDLAGQLAGQKALEDVRYACDAFQQGYASDWQSAGDDRHGCLGRTRDVLTLAAERLVDIVGAQLETSLLSEPTPVRSVNLVLKLAAAETTEEDLLKAIGMADALLAQEEGDATTDDFAEAVRQVRDCLADAGTRSPEALLALEDAAQNLGLFMVGTDWEDDDESLLDYTSATGLAQPALTLIGMPALFQSALDTAEAFARQACDEAAVYAAIDTLDHFVEQFEKKSGNLPDDERTYIAEALHSVQEAAGSLRHMVMTRDRHSLQGARSWLEAATNALVTGATS